MRTRRSIPNLVLSAILLAGCYKLNPSQYLGEGGVGSTDAQTQGADVAHPDVPMGGLGGGGDTGVRDAPDGQPDTPIGSSGGGTGGTGGVASSSTGGTTSSYGGTTISVGGTASSVGGTTSSTGGAAGSNGGTAQSTGGTTSTAGPGIFMATGSMTAERSSATATLLGNGKVLIAGGCCGAGLTSADLYDPAAGTFTATGSMAVAREAQTATLLSNGKVLIAGGDSGGSVYNASAELYDPAAGRFTATGSLTVARSLHTATLLPGGRVLIAGGNRSSGFSVTLASAELYDPGSGTFTATGSMAVARDSQTATLLSNGKVLIAGGRGVSGVAGSVAPVVFLASADLYQ
jgi:hypothetical protein